MLRCMNGVSHFQVLARHRLIFGYRLFIGNISVLVSEVKHYSWTVWPLKIRPVCFPETLVTTILRRITSRKIDDVIYTATKSRRNTGIRQTVSWVHDCFQNSVLQYKRSTCMYYATNTTFEHYTFIYLLFYDMFRPLYSAIIRRKHKYLIGKVCYGRGLR